MARSKRAIRGRWYVNTAVSTPYATPTWTNVVLLGDAQLTSDWATQDVNVRLTSVQLTVRTLMQLMVSGKLLKEKTNSAVMAKIAAAFLDPEVQLDILFLDGANTVDGAEGFRFHAEVVKFSEDHATGNVLYKDFELKPGLPDTDAEVPKSVTVTAGNPVYTALAA